MSESKQRSNFFDAQYLDVEDLTREQQYINTKIERLADNTIQTGIIEFKGLDVTADPILASPIDRNRDISALGFTDFPRLQSNGTDRFTSSQMYQIFKAYSNNVQRVDLRVHLLSADATETSNLIVQIRSLVQPTNPLSPISDNVLFERVIPRVDLPQPPAEGEADNSLLCVDMSSATSQKGVQLQEGWYYAVHVSFPGESTTEDLIRIYRTFNPATSSNTLLHANILDSTDRSLNSTLSTWFFNNDTKQYEQGLRDQNGNLIQHTVFHTVWTAAVKVNQGVAYIKGNYEIGSETVTNNGLPIVVAEDEHRFKSVLSDGTLNHVMIRYTQEGVDSIVQPRTGTPVFEHLEDKSEVIVISDPAFEEAKLNSITGEVDPETNREYPQVFEYPRASGKYYFELARVSDRNTFSLNRAVDIDVSTVTNLVYKDWRFPNNTIASARAEQIASQHPNDLVFYVDNVPVYIPRTIELELSRPVAPGDTAIYLFPSGTQDAAIVGEQILSGAYGGELPIATFEFGEITTYTSVAGIGDTNNDGYGDEIKLFGIPSTGENSIKIHYEVGTKVIVQRTEDLQLSTTTPSYETVRTVDLILKIAIDNEKTFTMNAVREVTTGVINNVTGQPNRYASYAVILTTDAANITPNTNVNTYILNQAEFTPNTFYNFMATTGAGSKIFYQDYDRPVFIFNDDAQEKRYVREEKFTFDLTAGQRIVTVPENLVLGVNTGATTLYDSKYDVNQDGSIDEKELIAFEATYGKALGDAGYDARFDFNHNNVVDDNDRYELERRFGAIANFTNPGTDGYGGIARDQHRIEAMIVYEQNNPLNKLVVINAASKQDETIIYFDEGASVSGTYVLEFGFSDALQPAQNEFTLLSNTNYEDTFLDFTSISIISEGLVETNIQVIKIDSEFDDDLQKYKNTFTVAPSFTVSGTYLITTNWNEARIASINRKDRAITSNYEYNLRRRIGPYNMTYDPDAIDVTGETFFTQFHELDSSWADGTFDSSFEHVDGEHSKDMFFNAYLFVENPTEPNSKPTTSIWIWYNLPGTIKDEKVGVELGYNDALFLTHRTQGKRLIGETSNSVVAQPFGLAEHQVTLKPEYAGGDIKNDLSNLIIMRADYADQFVKPHTHLDDADGGQLTSSQIRFDDPESRFPITGSVTDIIYYFDYINTRPVTNDRIADDAGIEAHKLNFKDTNLVNMLYNGSFERWPLGINFDVDDDDPTSPTSEDENDNSKLPLPWTKRDPEAANRLEFLVRPAKLKNYDEFTATQDVSRYLGQNAVRIVDKSHAGNALVQNVTIGEDLQERWVTFSCLAISYVPNSTFIYLECLSDDGTTLEFSDGSVRQDSNLHTGQPASIGAQFKYSWELLQVSAKIPVGTRTIIAALVPKLTSTTTTTTFWDSASLVLGRLAPGYAPVGGQDYLEVVSAATVAQKFAEWTVGFTNLISNGQFEGWTSDWADPYYTAPTVKEWNVDSGTAEQETDSDNIKSGNFSLKIGTTSIISQNIPFTWFEKIEEWKSRAETTIQNEPIVTYSKNSDRHLYLTFSVWIKSTGYDASTEQGFYDVLNRKCYLKIRAFDSNDVEITGKIKNALGYEGFPADNIVEDESRRTGSMNVDPSIEGVSPEFRRRDIFDEKGFEKLTLCVSYSSDDITDFDGYFKVEVRNDDATRTAYVDNAIAVEGKIVPIFTPKPIYDSGRDQKIFGNLQIHNSVSSGDTESLVIEPFSTGSIAKGIKVDNPIGTDAAYGITLEDIGSSTDTTSSIAVLASNIQGSSSAAGLFASTIESVITYGARLFTIGNLTTTTTSYGFLIDTVRAKSAGTVYGGQIKTIGNSSVTTTAGLHIETLTASVTARGTYVKTISANEAIGTEIDTVSGVSTANGIKVSTVSTSSTSGTTTGLILNSITASNTSGTVYGINGSSIGGDVTYGLRFASLGSIAANTTTGSLFSTLTANGTVIGVDVATLSSTTGSAYGFRALTIGGITAYGISVGGIGTSLTTTAYGSHISTIDGTSAVGSYISTVTGETVKGVEITTIGDSETDTVYGVKIYDLTTSEESYYYYYGSIFAYGIHMDVIGRDGTAQSYGLWMNAVKGYLAYGIKIDNVGGTNTTDPQGIVISNVTGAASNTAVGLNIESVGGVNSVSSKGIRIKTIYGSYTSGVAQGLFIETVSGLTAAYGTYINLISGSSGANVYGTYINGLSGTGANGYGLYISNITTTSSKWTIYKDIDPETVFDYHGDGSTASVIMRRSKRVLHDEDDNTVFQCNSTYETRRAVGMVTAIYRNSVVDGYGGTVVWHAFGTILATSLLSADPSSVLKGLQLANEGSDYAYANRGHIDPDTIGSQPTYPTIFWDHSTYSVKFRVPENTLPSSPYSEEDGAMLTVKVEWFFEN